MNSGTVGGNRWVHHQDIGLDADASDRRDVADEIETELVVERRVDGLARTDQEKRVAVRRRPHRRLGGDVAAGARPVLDDELLAEPLGKPLPHQACDDVEPAAGGRADDPTDRPRRIGLRPREMRHRRQRGSGRGQMQESTPGHVHRSPPVSTKLQHPRDLGKAPWLLSNKAAVAVDVP